MSRPFQELDSPQIAYQRGRRTGLATAALALSVVAFINLLGAEKAILAGVLAILALRGAVPGHDVLWRSRAALAIAAVYVTTIAIVLVAFHDKLSQLLHLLQKLS